MGELVKKIKEKKEEKENKLLNSAYNLFIKKGINNTSIQDIVDDAGVAKGTFYLYFSDKYKLQEALVKKKSSQLFNDALAHLNTNVITSFEDQLIFVINYVIDELIKNPDLIQFIYKDLSSGFYSNEINNLISNDEIGIYETFKKGIKNSGIKLENPEVTLYMIIELAGSTCFNSIVKKIPLSIDEYKPYLYKTIRLMLSQKTD